MTDNFDHKVFVKPAGSILVTSLILSILFVGLSYLCLTGKYAFITGAVLLFIFALICFCAFIHSVNFRILYDEKGFTLRNAFLIKRHFSYAEITGINMSSSPEDIIFFTENYHFRIAKNSSNAFLFAGFCMQRYQEIYGREFPKTYQTPHDFFERITAPYAILVILFSIFFIIMTGACIEYRIKNPQDDLLTFLLMCGCALVALFMLIAAILGGRDPEKHRFLARLIYKHPDSLKDDEEEL